MLVLMLELLQTYGIPMFVVDANVPKTAPVLLVKIGAKTRLVPSE